MRKIGDRFGIVLEATRIYSYPTLAKMSRHVHELLSAGSSAAPVPELSQPIAAPVEGRILTSLRRQARPVVAAAPDAIAVIGMAGQFPQARTVDEFWRNIAEGRNCIGEVGPERWRLSRARPTTSLRCVPRHGNAGMRFHLCGDALAPCAARRGCRGLPRGCGPDGGSNRLGEERPSQRVLGAAWAVGQGVPLRLHPRVLRRRAPVHRGFGGPPEMRCTQTPRPHLSVRPPSGGPPRPPAGQ